MGKVFEIYLSNNGNELDLTLPATDYTLLDAQERLELKPGEIPYLEITSVSESFEYLEKCMQELPDLYKLNGLARRLDELDEHGMAAFEGMVGMCIQKKDTPITVGALIDMSYNTEHCHVAPDVSTDYELGRFYAENDFYKETEGMTDAAFELLDFGRMGRESREAEGGVFTSFGYVVQESPPEQIADKQEYCPKKPEYTFQVGVRNHSDNDFPGEVTVYLPTGEATVQAIPGILGVESLDDARITSFDSPIPELERMFTSPADLPVLNELAEQVQMLDNAGKLSCFKAILLGTGCNDINAALELSKTTDDYILTREYRTPEDLARGELKVIVDPKSEALLLKHLNLYAYGSELLKTDNAMITDYGMLGRRDHQPIQAMDEQPRQEGGMTFG